MDLDEAPVVTDTNVIFSALLRREGRFLEILFESEHSFHICESVLSELFRLKEKIARTSELDEDTLARLYHEIISLLSIHKEARIAAVHWDRARALCDGVDPADAPHVALTLDLDGVLWTGDKRLRSGLRLKGFDRFFTP